MDEEGSDVLKWDRKSPEQPLRNNAKYIHTRYNVTVMYLIVECDGACNSAPVGEMATGVVIRQSEKTKCKSGEAILRVQEPAGTGTGQMAEMIALLRGLTETRKLFMGTPKGGVRSSTL